MHDTGLSLTVVVAPPSQSPFDLSSTKRMCPWPPPSHVPCCRDTDEDHDEPSYLVAVFAGARGATARLFDLVPAITVTITHRAGLPSAIVIAASLCS
jgi:hypothetical protein